MNDELPVFPPWGNQDGYEIDEIDLSDFFVIQYGLQFIKDERIENLYSNENKVTYGSMQPRCSSVIGYIYRNDIVVQTFVITDSGVFTFLNIDGNDGFVPESDSIYATDGSIDFDSGQISLTWNVNDPGSTYLVVSYEHPGDNGFI